MIKSYEDKLSESSGFGIQTTKFELGNVPVSKTKKLNVARSPDVSRKPVMSPKEIDQFKDVFKRVSCHLMSI